MSTDRTNELADRATDAPFLESVQGGEAGQATDGAAQSGGAAELRVPSAYLVPDWVRVRAEDFGLLFYDTRSTKLTFVRSGDALVPPAFTGCERALKIRAGGDDRGAGDALIRVLEGLVAKGLLLPGVQDG